MAARMFRQSSETGMGMFSDAGRDTVDIDHFHIKLLSRRAKQSFYILA